MTTIYGFKRPDGSVVVDTRWTLMANVQDHVQDVTKLMPWKIGPAGYTILPFTLGPDGSIAPPPPGKE